MKQIILITALCFFLISFVFISCEQGELADVQDYGTFKITNSALSNTDALLKIVYDGVVLTDSL